MFVLFLAGLILMGFAVTLIARGASAPRVRTVENLGQIDQYGFTAHGAEEEEDKRGPVTRFVDSAAARVGERASARMGQLDQRELRNTLVAAGLFHLTPARFTGYRVLSVIASGALWVWFGAVKDLNAAIVVLGVPVFLFLGWQVPLSVVRVKARRRLEQIDYDLPELIDLLVVTVEAGVGFVQSLQIAAERLTGPLGDELRLVLQEQAMGLGVNEALRSMLERCDTPAVRSFVRSVLQGETLGVSIGQIMRNLADEMRKRRRAAAEERAQKAPIKMLFPLIFLIFPAMFVVLLGPAIFSFLRTFHGG